MLETVHVPLGERAYDVLIGRNLNIAEHVTPLLGSKKKVCVLTEVNVDAHHGAALEESFDTCGITVSKLVLPSGEATKSWPYLEQSVEWLLAEKVERGDIIIAFGGGVIGDLGGFAAAILRRGVRFVQVPTTLLAQVDSSVGGKTGINSPAGKNLIGAFHQPALVLADIAYLDTLPERDFLAGYGEVQKYGLLGDEAFFEWLETNGSDLKEGSSEARMYAIKRSVEMKADIVVRDETEQGDRALLNLGHTFCHALEAATGYSNRLLHGEGVAIGCALAFELSARLGLCSQEAPSRVRAHLKEMGMKYDLSDIEGELPSPDMLADLMSQDKKVVNGQLRFVLARAVGDSFVTADVPREAVLDVLKSAS